MTRGRFGRSSHERGLAEEMIDYYDANMNWLGVVDRSTAHRDGLWHRTVHIWLVSRAKGGALFLQHRSDAVSSFPGYMDVSVAGHLLAGETPDQSFREVEEELGIDLAPESLVPIGIRTEAMDLPDGQRNRERQLIYLAETPLLPGDCRPDPAEVQGLYLLRVADLFALFDGESRTASGIALVPGGAPLEREITLSMADLVPRIGDYYACVAIMAERMMAGLKPLAI